MPTLQELTLGGHHVRTIMLTTSIEKTHVVQAQQHGVSGILLKETSPQVLYESVRSVAAGHCWLGSERLDDLLEGLRHLGPASENRFGLTLRELEIADAVRRGDTNKTIGRELSITPDTVKHHLTKIFAKIGVCNRLQLAMFAQNHTLLHHKAGGSGAAVHHSQRDREQQEPDRAAPEPDRFEQKHPMRERGDRADRERQRRKPDEQPAGVSHARDYSRPRRRGVFLKTTI
jgi:DNA-binding NarL/FixJ family response regulator